MNKKQVLQHAADYHQNRFMGEKIRNDCLKKQNTARTACKSKDEKEKFHCSVCGREISEEEYESFDGMCWKCWNDQLTEESDMMFGDLM
jgi:hypothetical protein